MERVNIDIAPSISNRPINSGHVTKSMLYVNETGIPIYVTEPSGGHFIVLPDSEFAPVNRFTIYVTYRAGTRYGGFQGLSENTLAPAQYRQAMSELTSAGESTVRYVVEGADLMRLMRGETLIIQRLATALSLEPFRMGREILETKPALAQQFQLRVAVVQPHEDMVLKRWVRYYSSLIEVQPIRSVMYEPGIYLFVCGGENVEPNRIHFDFDDPLSPLRAFEHVEGARQWRWRDNRVAVDELQRKLKTLVHEAETGLEDKRAELDLEYKRKAADIAYEKELLSLRSKEQEASFRSHEFDLKSKAAVRDDIYDERSTVRKGASDALKVIPSLLVLGATIIGLM